LNLALREAGPRDLEAVLAMDRQHSPVFASVQRYASLHGDRGLLLVAADTDGIRGFGAWSRVLDEASLLNLALLPAARGTGLARALLAAGCERLAREGVQRVFLEVRESNRAARRLYTAAGLYPRRPAPGLLPRRRWR
jgi:ribosomal-protein-alanine N-acetyltransferase